jgi:hypothetical protein
VPTYPWACVFRLRLSYTAPCAVQCVNFVITRMFYSAEQRLLTSGVFMDTLARRLIAASAGTPQPDWDYSSYPSSVSVPGSRQWLGPRLLMYRCVQLNSLSSDVSF